MNAVVLQEELSNLVLNAVKFVSSRSQLPILNNLLIKVSKNKLTINSTNLETSFSSYIGAKVELEGEIVVPGRLLSEFVPNLQKGQITLKVDKERLTVSSSDLESVILGINASEFPAVPEEIKSEKLKLNKTEISSAFSKCLFAVSADEARPVLTGMLFDFNDDGLGFIATDGYRLSKFDILLDAKIDNGSFILPKSTIVNLLKTFEKEELSLDIDRENNQIVISDGKTVVTSRIINGTFPDYKRIIPKSFNIELEVGIDDLKRGLKTASVFAKDSGNLINLIVDKNALKITSESGKSGKQEIQIPAKVQGQEGFKIIFNYKYLEEFAQSVEGESVLIKLTSESSAGVFLDPTKSNYLHLIMPVKS